MKTLIKLAILGLTLALLTPIISPGSSVASFVSAALDDARGFCDRRPEACDQGAQFAHQTALTLKSALSTLLSDAPDEGTLTADDRALEPTPQTADATAPQPAIAAHNTLQKP